ncbi:unnamed protein product [Linum trigynum]|uniref:Uncharacterized protein n=1 Tax=Linum trigynum TaxID=586398 RepID=A0AAV2DVF2_9ROSI
MTEEEDLRTLLKKVLITHTRDQEAHQADSQEIWRAIGELREFVMQRQGQPRARRSRPADGRRRRRGAAGREVFVGRGRRL